MKWLTEGSTSIFCCFELEVKADKTKYVVRSRDQYVRCSHSIKMDNISFARVEEFKYLGTKSTNQNSIQEEIKRRLKSGNVCYHSVHFTIKQFKNIYTEL